MSGGFSDPIIGGGGALVYPSIHSPNYSAGPPVTGWTINKDGSASFGSNVTVTGAFTIYNSHGAVIYKTEPSKDAWFLYADTGSASQGALIASAASAAGTDDFGNTFEAGLNAYIVSSVSGSVGTWAINLAALGAGSLPGLIFQNLSSPQNQPPSIVAAGSAAGGAAIQINSGKSASANQTAFMFFEDSTYSSVAGGLISLDSGELDIDIWTGSSYNAVLIITRDAGGTGYTLTEGYARFLNQASAPAAVSGEPILYADAKGFLNTKADSAFGDTTTYQVGHATFRNTTDQTGIVGQTTIAGLQATLGAGLYVIEGAVSALNSGVGAGTLTVGVNGGATAANVVVDLEWFSATANTFKAAGQMTALSQRVGTVSNVNAAGAETVYAKIRGILNLSAAGTIGLTAGVGTAAAMTVKGFSFMKITPVN